MVIKILCWLVLALAGTFLGRYVMQFFLQRNAKLLLAYKLEPGRVCHPLTLFLGTAVMLFLGVLIPQTLVAKVLCCVLLYWLWLLWLIDWRYQFIFDDMVLPLAALCAVLMLYTGAPVWKNLAAAAGTFVVLAAFAILGRGALGGGDVKMMAALALALGVEGVIIALFLGFIFGGVAAVVLLLVRKAGRNDFFAFGPFLIIGTIIAWMTLALNW